MYLILRIGETNYDQYKGAVVVAPSEDVAILMHPEDGSLLDRPTSHKSNGWNQHKEADGTVGTWRWPSESWPRHGGVTCKLLGPASSEYTETRVILASFLAG